MYKEEAKLSFFCGGSFGRGNSSDYRNHYKEEKDKYFVPQEHSKLFKCKSQRWYRYEN